ncbi:MAG: hypothetical protein D6788_07140 [Planctomycetota bacterium]|nr:MAG: hypothetical protein D6788_07140 [Planctomycetota bacterium]
MIFIADPYRMGESLLSPTLPRPERGRKQRSRRRLYSRGTARLQTARPARRLPLDPRTVAAARNRGMRGGGVVCAPAAVLPNLDAMSDPTSTPRTRTNRRLLIVGWDGATFDVLRPLIDAGKLPHLARLVENGAWGTLHSTVPPITPAAWTTFLTGKHPGTHGIIDFERYDPLTHTLQMNSTRCLDSVRNLWQILGEAGLRVGSINVPMTYPPVPVNGFLVSGFETPGPDCEFVYPSSVREDILQRWPDPTLRSKWHRRPFGGDRLFAENLDYMARSFHQGAEMTVYLGDRFGWNVLMVVLKLIDNLQHKTWKYIDPRWRDRNPRRRRMVEETFAEADRALATLLEYADRRDADVLMVSDHGHGSLEGKVQPNLLLARWGYLKLNPAAQGTVRLRKLIAKRFRRRTTRSGELGEELAVDFSRTRACVMHAGMAGFLYLNLQGRQPNGIVPPQEYERLRDELRRRFLGPECRVTDPAGRTVPLFTAVHKPEELYGCTREHRPWLPDLMLIPHEALAVVRKIRGHQPVRWLPYRRIEGTHRPEGILIAAGGGIARRGGIEAHIVDCAPTILAHLGIPVPEDMEGRVIDELFESPPAVQRAAVGGQASATSPPPEEVYSEKDLQRITERLSDLGYLE